ncbi:MULTISPECIES: acyl-CoA dehydrogenase family protein [Bradyrhizobium]|uniref:acyl-CoA dehydrogenase family protein n=1 Tax=Bradyrhizobium elkanii TaxID=29448 RepID=UPI00040F252B|nr:acyl-CoA dehydrogenase family protein [Bradyrhizobium elkanii]
MSVDAELAAWLDRNAFSLDTENTLAGELLPRLAAGGLLGAGLPVADGGAGGDVTDGVEAIAAASEHSVAAGFVLWAHRSYIEYLLQSPNAGLRQALLPDLLAGRVAGATGLSNAMKFLSGIEELQVNVRAQADGLVLDGMLPWVTNLRWQGFHLAVAVARKHRRGAFIASVAHDDAGLSRSADLDIIALRASNTAGATLSGVQIDADRVIHPDANVWLPEVRPAFLGLQCGMSIGLARRALAEAHGRLAPRRQILTEPVIALTSALVEQESNLREGLRSGMFRAKPEALFKIRIALADIVMQAVGLELQSTGGRGYLRASGASFDRRWREAAFIPVVTPSLVQLKTALAAYRESGAVA